MSGCGYLPMLAAARAAAPLTTTVGSARFAKLFSFCIEKKTRLTTSVDAFRWNNFCCIAWDGQISPQTLSFGNKLKDIRKNWCISGIFFPLTVV